MCADGRERDRAGAGASGFTLLEVVVALAIAALALVGLFEVGSGGLVAADTAVRTEEAVERAQSHLAAFVAAETIRPGNMSGDDGDGYRWAVRVAPIAQRQTTAQQDTGGLLDTSQAAGPGQVLYEIVVTISWRSGRRERSIVLETRRLGVAPSAE